jgi:inhibitor of cysteine peptidase
MTEADVTVQVNETFSIDLESNPTTGYTWNVHADENIVNLVDKIFEERSSHGRVGNSGKDIFTFKGLKSGETALHFYYFRTWESQENATRDYTVTVSVI